MAINMSSATHANSINRLANCWWYHPDMGINAPGQSGPHSPFDPYISQVMRLIASSDDISISGLGDACARELQWLPGFCEVVINILRTNGLILIFEWEPGKVHISERGQQWVLANRESISIS
jgi:hypothetical protein